MLKLHAAYAGTASGSVIDTSLAAGLDVLGESVILERILRAFPEMLCKAGSRVGLNQDHRK